MEKKKQLQQRVGQIMPQLRQLSDTIYQNPEYNFQEYKACKAVANTLENLDFQVQTGVYNLETSVYAVYDSGKPGYNFGFLGEYDAFPGMGHSCGHNIMTPIAIGAAYALIPLIEEIGGKITVIGCPAEEGGGGKVLMAEQGAFKELDTAMLIHSSCDTCVNDFSYSRTDVEINFYGKPSHAATWPEEGINALVPVLELFNTLSAIRPETEHLGKIIGIITKGGEDPIWVPEHCQALFTVRSFVMKDKWALYDKLIKICSHLAEITGTRFEYSFHGQTYEDIRNNEVMEEYLAGNLAELGEVVEARHKDQGVGCTDMGNVTHIVPGFQSYIKVAPAGTRVHTPEFEAACGTPAAAHAIEVAAKALAMTAADLLLVPGAMGRVKAAFASMKAQYE